MDEMEDFLKEPSLEKLEVMRKSVLLEVGEKLELETKKAMRKEKIVRIIVEHMVDEQIFETEVLERHGPETKTTGEAKPHGGVSSSQESKIYQPYVRKGKIIDEEGNSTPVTILRDTGAAQSLILEKKVPHSRTIGSALIQGVGGKAVKVPLKKIKLITGRVKKEDGSRSGEDAPHERNRHSSGKRNKNRVKSDG